ncbi:MAG: ABC transporter substrate-binding protein [Porcipelethomonas sp.]
MKIKSILKKAAAVSLAAVMTMGAAGCGSKDSSAEGKKKVYVMMMVENGAFLDMKDGFIQELRDKGFTEDKCEIIYKCAQGDATNMNTIVQDAISQKPDAIATVGTPASQAVVGAQSDIPDFFISVGDPVGAGLISDMDAAPDMNATGTSNAVPVSEIFGLSEQLTPDVKTYGILYNTGEVNSVHTAENAKKYLDEKGLKYIEKTVTAASEVQTAAEALASQVDAIFVPNDSIIQTAMPLVSQIARENKIPVYGSSAVMVESGAFATKAISDTKIGAITADKCADYLNGKAVRDIPAEVVQADDIVINSNAAEAIGVTIPDDIKSTARVITDTNEE